MRLALHERLAKPGVCRLLGPLVLAAMLLVLSAHAVNPDLRISQYSHASWRLRDGSFRDRPAPMAQTKDGYMWMGTRVGLLRFDGVRFVPFTSLGGKLLPAGPVLALLGARDGSLWIGTGSGLAQWKNDQLLSYPALTGRVVQILEDAKGTIWVARADREGGPLCEIVRGHTRCFGVADGLPSRTCCAESMVLDGSGSVWVGAGDVIVQIKDNSAIIHKVSALSSNNTADIQGLAANSDGSLWVGMAISGAGRGLQRLMNDAWKPFSSPQLDGTSIEVTDLLLDHLGNLWVGTADKGLYRIYGGRVDHFGEADGLTSNFVSWIFEDVEGNIWVTTAKGLDGFRDLQVTTWSAHEGLTADNVSSVTATPDGTVWVGNAGGLDAVRDGDVVSVRTGKGLPGSQVTAVFADHTGQLWVGVDNGLWIVDGSRFKRVSGPGGKETGPISAVTEDSKGNIWAVVYGSGKKLLRIVGDKVREEVEAPESRTLTADSHDNIWIGLKSGDLAVYRNGRVETISYPQEVKSTIRQVIDAGNGYVLVAGTAGIAEWRDGKKETLSVRNGLPCNDTYGLVLDGAGNLWTSSMCGILKIERTSLQQWRSNPTSMVSPMLYEGLDGAQTAPSHFNAAAARSPDGRLWFAMGTDLQMINPGRFSRNLIPPPVHVEEILADHKSYLAQNGVRLPPLTNDLEIDYAALSFIVPQKVRFRYRLEGHDEDWQDPGTRRQAFYNSLGPGSYRFHVIACNNDGIWNNDGATLAFVIPPAFYQAWWFRLLCGLAAAGALWMFYLYRLNEATVKVQERLGGRLEERERIARELHDTLLQGFQGLVLRFQAVLNSLPEEERARPMMERVLSRADEVLLEGRQRVRDLRAQSMAGEDLPNNLKRCGEELSEDGNILFSLSVLGTPQLLDPDVCNDAYRIGREALVNAFQHSRAATIEAELTYDLSGLRLTVRDDGCGLDQAILDRGREGHWGLAGMRERARTIGAQLNIWSRSRAGTEVELKIPAKIAYPSSAESSMSQRVRRLLVGSEENKP